MREYFLTSFIFLFFAWCYLYMTCVLSFAFGVVNAVSYLQKKVKQFSIRLLAGGHLIFR